jgi:hypothetical protein
MPSPNNTLRKFLGGLLCTLKMRRREGGKKKTLWGLFMEIPNYKKTVLHYFAFRYLFFLFF